MTDNVIDAIVKIHLLTEHSKAMDAVRAIKRYCCNMSYNGGCAKCMFYAGSDEAEKNHFIDNCQLKEHIPCNWEIDKIEDCFTQNLKMNLGGN